MRADCTGNRLYVSTGTAFGHVFPAELYVGDTVEGRD